MLPLLVVLQTPIKASSFQPTTEQQTICCIPNIKAAMIAGGYTEIWRNAAYKRLEITGRASFEAVLPD